jgi:hypothetical protein
LKIGSVTFHPPGYCHSPPPRWNFRCVVHLPSTQLELAVKRRTLIGRTSTSLLLLRLLLFLHQHAIQPLRSNLEHQMHKKSTRYPYSYFPTYLLPSTSIPSLSFEHPHLLVPFITPPAEETGCSFLELRGLLVDKKPHCPPRIYSSLSQ